MGSGMGKISGSGIRDKHPGSATLQIRDQIFVLSFVLDTTKSRSIDEKYLQKKTGGNYKYSLKELFDIPNMGLPDLPRFKNLDE
jgi:hypothetical protein